ncbi:MAG: YdcF family protein [Opitutaceae bacterium]
MPPPGVLIVLGSPNDEHGNLHSLAVERCRRALRLHRDNPGWPLLLTGGFGEHFNTTAQPHAAYLRRWLEEHGVPAAAFLPFAESRNTLEDASLARPILLATGARVALVVTSDYHADRARFVFEREFAGTGVTLCFVATETDESACRLDLAALKRHEVAALARLRSASDVTGRTEP